VPNGREQAQLRSGQRQLSLQASRVCSGARIQVFFSDCVHSTMSPWPVRTIPCSSNSRFIVLTCSSV
jgi:hypothetical protein